MPDIGKLTSQRPVDFAVDLGDGDVVTLTVDINRVTPVWVAESTKRLQAQDVLALPEAIAHVLVDWNVTQEGQAYPPTAENIGRFPLPVVGRLFEAVMDAATPTSEEGNGSNATSSTPNTDSTEKPEQPQNGRATSTSLTASAFPSTK